MPKAFERFKYSGKEPLTLLSLPTTMAYGGNNKQERMAKLFQNTQKITSLQEKLLAEAKQGLLVVLQGMDASGKDGAVKYVFSGLNPSGLEVHSFKQPATAELAHDYLWRIHSAVPKRGTIGVFNRSHYEDVLIARVLNLPKAQNLIRGSSKKLWQNRYRQIRDFERYLTENNIKILKFFLYISKEEQRTRFLERIDTPPKNWKFEAGDLETRSRWDDYTAAYQECLTQTATTYAPWYIIPADKKWAARLAISDIVLASLQKMAPRYPALSSEEAAALQQYRGRLV